MTKMKIEKDIYKLLEELTEKPKKLKEIAEKIPKISVDLLKNLESIGFIKRNESLLMSSSKWELTPQGISFLKLRRNFEEETSKNYDIVMSLPPSFKNFILEKHKGIHPTESSFKSLFLEAKSRIRILSPYVDASILDFLKNVNNETKIQILTVPSKYGNNPVLERLKQSIKNLEIKYLFESKGGIQQFQIHAKLIICDNQMVYLGSANFKDTSILYNLETGLVSYDEKLIQEYISIYDDIYSITK